MDRDQALDQMRKMLKDSSAEFRIGQWESLELLLENKKVLVIQKTGWGKSMVYFLATKILQSNNGLTLVISPLIALMRDQFNAATKLGLRAAVINSSNTTKWPEIKDKLKKNELDILFISPERLNSNEFKESFLNKISERLSLLVIDEAHCISEWGHDFRPDYNQISKLILSLDRTIPVLATTATATDRVVLDIMAQIGDNVEVLRGDLSRPSLYLQNLPTMSYESRMLWLLHNLKNNIPGSGIVYTLTIRDSELIAAWLRSNGISAYAYNSKASLPADYDPVLFKKLIEGSYSQKSEFWRVQKYREYLEQLLINNKVKVLVSTSALGMGFDKPDLAFVIHFQRPKSLIDYYQQIGRAGRAIDKAYAIMLGGNEDERIAEYFINNSFPTAIEVQTILDYLKNHSGIHAEMCKDLNMSDERLDKVLSFLENADDPPIYRPTKKYEYEAMTGLYALTESSPNYKFPSAMINEITNARYSDRDSLKRYIESKGCLMSHLCGYLDSTHTYEPCTHCCICDETSLIKDTTQEIAVEDPLIFFDNLYPPLNTHKSWAVTTTFPQMKEPVIKIKEELRPEQGWSLSVLGYGHIGKKVKESLESKDNPFFEDSIAEAVVALLNKKDLIGKINWITSIPSTKTNNPIKDLAQRLAKMLNIEYLDYLVCKNDKKPQSLLNNNILKQKNVELSLELNKKAFCIRGGYGLLLDDIVESKWTMTAAAALLKRRGGANTRIIPLALADSSIQFE